MESFLPADDFGNGEHPPISDSIGRGETRPDLPELFHDLVRRLRVQFRFDRALLIVRSRSKQHLLAVARQDGREGLRRLELTLPLENSLLAKVAEGGFPYAESYCGFYSGNASERRLLFDDSANSFALLPVKHDGRVVGVLGFSAEDPEAFRLFEDADWDRLVPSLGASLAEHA